MRALASLWAGIIAITLALITVALCVAGCARNAENRSISGDTSAAVPSNYRDLVSSAMRSSLKDPYSVRDAQISEPTQMWVGLFNGGTMPTVCVRLNAKNSFGAYTGVQTQVFMFRNGAPAEIGHTPEGCANLPYSPFPELEGVLQSPGGASPDRP